MLGPKATSMKTKANIGLLASRRKEGAWVFNNNIDLPTFQHLSKGAVSIDIFEISK